MSATRATRRLGRILPPLLLAAATAGAAVWWTVSVVHVPASVRRSLSAGLGAWFPGGVRFRSASQTGEGLYRVLGFEAFPAGSDRPWVTAASLELRLSEGRIVLVRFESPVVRLGPGASLLPEGGFRAGSGGRPLPEVQAENGTVLLALPGAAAVSVPLAANLSLRFGPASGVEGRFDSPAGAFRLQGSFDLGARSSLRASTDRVEIPPGSPLREAAGPVEVRGKSSGVLALSFGGGEPTVLSGNLSMQGMELEAAGVRLAGVRADVKGREGPGGFVLDGKMTAATISTGGLTAENAVLSLSSFSPPAFAGEAVFWRGRLKFRGTRAGSGIEGEVKGADLADMPPGFLGAATPAGGAAEVRFTWDQGVLDGEFQARDARLWGIPLLSGIRRLVPGFGMQEGLFPTARGRFRTAGGVTDVPSLELEGTGFGLTLSKPGRVGPERRLDLDFELRWLRDDRGEGLPPLRTLVDALGRALWKPIGKHLLFHVKIGGTLDAPTHELVSPLGLGK